jgi:uncharacterized membrane protein
MSFAFSSFLSVLSLLGLASCYVFYRQQQGGDSLLVRVICGGSSCELLSASRYARIFYFPNWYYGIAFYLGVIAVALLRVHALLPLVLAASVVATGCSFYLFWALVFRLRMVCRACYLAHAVNIGLLVALGWAVLR